MTPDRNGPAKNGLLEHEESKCSNNEEGRGCTHHDKTPLRKMLALFRSAGKIVKYFFFYCVGWPVRGSLERRRYTQESSTTDPRRFFVRPPGAGYTFPGEFVCLSCFRSTMLASVAMCLFEKKRPASFFFTPPSRQVLSYLLLRLGRLTAQLTLCFSSFLIAHDLLTTATG